MTYSENTGAKENTDTNEDQHLVLDGTVNPDYSDDDQIPRVKGLIELLAQYLVKKSDQNL
ncbi:MAG: hypothetical protein OEO19_12205 [Gammaproteobacteria bacterium]|nr:hypothetical protein [Gammaproteobacteria bacterium]